MFSNSKEIKQISDTKNNFLKSGESIGGGNYGSVYPRTYTGNIHQVKALARTTASGEKIVLTKEMLGTTKWQRKIYLNDQRMNDLLNSTQDPNLRRFFPRAITVHIDLVPTIVLEQILFNATDSADVGKFIDTMVNNTQWKIRNKNDAYLYAGMGSALNEFAISMWGNQNKLHEMGVLHGDTAPRNYLVTPPEVKDGKLTFGTMIIDFGLSQKIPPDGKATLQLSKEKFAWNEFPLAWYDQGMRKHINEDYLNDKVLTLDIVRDVSTDLFSMRIAIIEMLGRSLGMTSAMVLQPSKLRVNANNELLSDKEVLSQCLDRVEVTAKALLSAKHDKRGKVALSFIESYKNYLTTMIEPQNKTIAEICLADNKLITAAHDQFSSKLDKLDPNKIMQTLMHPEKRVSQKNKHKNKQAPVYAVAHDISESEKPQEKKRTKALTKKKHIRPNKNKPVLNYEIADGSPKEQTARFFQKRKNMRRLPALSTEKTSTASEEPPVKKDTPRPN